MAVLYYLPPQFKKAGIISSSNSVYTKTNNLGTDYYTTRASTKVSVYNGKTETTTERTYTVKDVWETLVPAANVETKQSSSALSGACGCGCDVNPISKVEQFIAAYDEAAPINDFTHMSENDVETFLSGLAVDVDCECDDHTCATHETILIRDIATLFKGFLAEE